MKIFIGYVSMSGNTEDMANILKEELLSVGCEVDMECLETVEVEEISTYDCIFIGTYTWGDGDLPYEAEDFYEDLNDFNFQGLHAVCFGSGDHAYPKFCAAVDTFADRLIAQGCNVFNQRLKMELSPESDEQVLECEKFAQAVIQWVHQKEVEHV